MASGFWAGMIERAGQRQHEQNLLDIQQKVDKHKAFSEHLQKILNDPSTKPEAWRGFQERYMEAMRLGPMKFKNYDISDLLTIQKQREQLPETVAAAPGMTTEPNQPINPNFPSTPGAVLPEMRMSVAAPPIPPGMEYYPEESFRYSPEEMEQRAAEQEWDTMKRRLDLEYDYKTKLAAVQKAAKASPKKRLSGAEVKGRYKIAQTTGGIPIEDAKMYDVITYGNIAGEPYLPAEISEAPVTGKQYVDDNIVKPGADGRPVQVRRRTWADGHIEILEGSESLPPTSYLDSSSTSYEAIDPYSQEKRTTRTTTRDIPTTLGAAPTTPPTTGFESGIPPAYQQKTKPTKTFKTPEGTIPAGVATDTTKATPIALPKPPPTETKPKPTPTPAANKPGSFEHMMANFATQQELDMLPPDQIGARWQEYTKTFMSEIHSAAIDKITVPPALRGSINYIKDDVRAVLNDPDSFQYYDKDKQDIIRRAMNSVGIPVPKPIGAETKNKENYAAITLMGATALEQLALNNPTLIHWFKGRYGKIALAIGSDTPLGAIDSALFQEIATRAQYFLTMEAKVLMGSRPAMAYVSQLKEVTAHPHMSIGMFVRALHAAKEHARYTIMQANRERFGNRYLEMIPSWDDPYMPGATMEGYKRLNIARVDGKEMVQMQTAKERNYRDKAGNVVKTELWWANAVPDPNGKKAADGTPLIIWWKPVEKVKKPVRSLYETDVNRIGADMERRVKEERRRIGGA